MQKMILFEKEEYDYATRRYSETDDYPTNYIISPFNKKESVRLSDLRGDSVPVYCDVIIKRWENLTGQKAVLAE